MDDMYPQILDFLRSDDTLMEIFRLTKNHRMMSRIEQERLLDKIHTLVSNRLTPQQQLKCYTQKEIQNIMIDKDQFKKPMIVDALKGYYDLADLLQHLGIL